MNYFIAVCIFLSGCSTKDILHKKNTNCEASIAFKCECDCDDGAVLSKALKTTGAVLGADVVVDKILD